MGVTGASAGPSAGSRRIATVLARARLSTATVAVIVAALVASAIPLVVGAPSATAATIPTPVTCSSPPPGPGTPLVTSFDFSPRTVDVLAEPRTVAVTVKAIDVGFPAQDIRSITVTFESPVVGGRTRHATATLTRSAGSAQNGTWKGRVRIPRWTNGGTWEVSSVLAVDVGGGRREYWPGYRPGSAGWPTSWPHFLEVTSHPDVTAPRLTGLRFSTTNVSTRSASATVTVRATTRDTRAGASSVALLLRNPGSSGLPSIAVRLSRSGGDRTRATFGGKFTIPRWVGAKVRTWRPSVEVRDRRGNRTAYSVAAMKTLHPDARLRVRSTTDTTGPVLTTATFAPRTIDVRTVGRKVIYTVAAGDVTAGVNTVAVTFTAAHRTTHSVALTRVSGTVHRGVWRGTVSFPACVPEPGTWTASIRISDRASNVSAFTAGRLAARHQPVDLVVRSIDRTAPYAELPPGPVPVEGGVLLRFSEPVLLTEPASWLLQVDFAVIGGTWTCRDDTGTVVVCDADGAGVRTISFTPRDGPFEPGTHHSIGSAPAHETHPGIYDTAGNELMTRPLYFNFTT